MPTLGSSLGGSNFPKAKVDCSKPQESSKVDQHPYKAHTCMRVQACARTHMHTHTQAGTKKQKTDNFDRTRPESERQLPWGPNLALFKGLLHFLPWSSFLTCSEIRVQVSVLCLFILTLKFSFFCDLTFPCFLALSNLMFSRIVGLIPGTDGISWFWEMRFDSA